MEKKTLWAVIGVVALILVLSMVGYVIQNGFENPFASGEKASQITGEICTYSEKEQVYTYEGVGGSSVEETQNIVTEENCCVTINGEIVTTDIEGAVETESYEVTKCE